VLGAATGAAAPARAQATTIAVLLNPNNPDTKAERSEVQAAAPTIGQHISAATETTETPLERSSNAKPVRCWSVAIVLVLRGNDLSRSEVRRLISKASLILCSRVSTHSSPALRMDRRQAEPFHGLRGHLVDFARHQLASARAAQAIAWYARLRPLIEHVEFAAGGTSVAGLIRWVLLGHHRGRRPSQSLLG
jgi:hypothetical protein